MPVVLNRGAETPLGAMKSSRGATKLFYSQGIRKCGETLINEAKNRYLGFKPKKKLHLDV